MEKIQISTTQAFMLGISSITVTGHLLFIPVIINQSGRDSWISVLCTLIPVVVLGCITAHLAQRYPGKTIMEYSEDIMGKWLGKLFAFLFIFYFFHDASISIRGFGEFFTTAVTPRTPILVYMSCIVFLAAFTVRSGLETMARTNQIFLFSMIPIGLLASTLTHKDKDFQNFLPVLEHGMKPVLLGSLSLFSLFSTFFVMGMIFPYVRTDKQLKRYSMLTMIILIIMFLGPITGPVALFGAERSQGLSFPTFQILRDIKVGQLQRLDFIGILLWSLGSYAKISLFLYATCMGTAKLFRLNNHTKLTTPFGILLIIVSLLNEDNFVGLYRFLTNIYPYYSTLLGFLLPCILLVVSMVRRPSH
ncbi:GerAB/ArcD/ProY family transporter [Paenibacillus sedimenti]|uniref:Endospore germination permease n=1 Tax=Paenibacillus sedimenti TaxID=2770274 RepID=A0A926QIP9_9BACL|nr:endospore germination permease [Paenibacillus sedimenti]MBD0380740.1 endospore germination permease [Paenibacillus sedimenti]